MGLDLSKPVGAKAVRADYDAHLVSDEFAGRKHVGSLCRLRDKRGGHKNCSVFCHRQTGDFAEGGLAYANLDPVKGHRSNRLAAHGEPCDGAAWRHRDLQRRQRAAGVNAVNVEGVGSEVDDLHGMGCFGGG